MRYKNGGPIQIYVVIGQETGEILAVATHHDTAQLDLMGQEEKCKLITYVQKDKK